MMVLEWEVCCDDQSTHLVRGRANKCWHHVSLYNTKGARIPDLGWTYIPPCQPGEGRDIYGGNQRPAERSGVVWLTVKVGGLALARATAFRSGPVWGFITLVVCLFCQVQGSTFYGFLGNG